MYVIAIRRVMRRMMAGVIRMLLRLLYRIEVRGELQQSERMLIVSNHQSFLDAVILWAFLPVQPTYLVNKTVASRWYFRLPLLFARYEVADTASPMSIKTLVGLVEAGHPVMIFPEGRLTATGSLMKIYDGPAFVAAKTGCTVAPIHIDGAAYSPFSRVAGEFPRKLFPRITVTIHPGVVIGMPEARTAKLRRRIASEQMRRLMQETAFQSRKRTTLFDAFLDAAKLHGWGRRLLQDIGTNYSPVSNRKILKSSLALGRLVTKLAAERETVGVLMPNANATVYLLLGMFAMRRTPAMLNFTAGVEGLRNACRVAGIKTILTSHAFVEKARLEQTISRLDEARVVYLEDLRPQFTLAGKLWLMGWALWNPRAARRPSRPEDPAIVLFTSGSEGVSKGVVLSHDSILANCAQIGAAFPFSARDSFLSALPLFHAFGITAGLFLPLLKGCKVVLYPSPLHYRTIPEYVYDHDCTVLFTTNTFLRNYAKAAHPYDFYNVRYLAVGAEKLTADVERLCFEKFGLRPLEGYGATECSPVISVNTPLANRPGSVGEPLPGLECRLAPAPGIEGAGVLHVRGDNVMLGYLKHGQPGVIQPPASQFGPGWYDTGDVVTIEGGYIAIQARLKRFAKIAGEMVSLETVELIAAEAHREAMHAAAAFKDAARGEAVALFTDSRDLKREDLIAAARRLGAPELAIPRRIVRLDKIPLLGNGKKDYMMLQKMAEEIPAPTKTLP